MSLSAVMPNFNHASSLPRALSALLSQNPPPTEIIVVDDGSTDDSVAVIEAFQRKHPSVRLVRHDTNRGAPAALNTGLAAATGEFVFFPAADDFVLPGLFATGLAALRAHPDAALFCAEVVLISPDGKVVGFRPFMAPLGGYLTPKQVRTTLRASDNWIVGPSVIYRRERLVTIGGFDESLGALCDGMAVRALALQHGFCFAPQVLAAWVVYPESLSARSALSVTKTRQLIAGARRKITETFPSDVRDSYGELLERRLRFNMARLWLVWDRGHPNADAMSDILGFSGLDRAILSFFAPIPFLGRIAVLAWAALRTRPFHMSAIIGAWFRNSARNRSRRRAAEKLLAEAGRPHDRDPTSPLGVNAAV